MPSCRSHWTTTGIQSLAGACSVCCSMNVVTYDLSGPTGEFVLAPRGPVMVRILLADDHDIIRRGLRAVLQEHVGWEICGEALSARQTVDLVQALQPDIVIMDLTMSSPGG